MRYVPLWRDCRPTDIHKTHLLACVGLLAVGMAAQFWYLVDHCPLDLSGDEAHYWEWARHPALSYYSKGPLVAYIIAISRWFLAGWSVRTVGSEALAVRLPAMLLSVLTTLGTYKLATDILRRSRPALAAVALTFTIPILAAGSILMTIDAPLVCAWTWTLVFLHRGLERDTLGTWAVAGLLIAGGILAKYTMLLIFPSFGLLLLAERRLRPMLRRPGPYLAMMIGLTGVIPVVIWNAGHDWVSFRHVEGQAGLANGLVIDPGGVLSYVAGQAAVIGGVWFVGMVWALIDVWRRPCDRTPEIHDPYSIKLLLFAAGIPWLVFLVFSFMTNIQPNWPVVGLIPGTILMSLWLGRRLRLPTRGGRAGARAFIAGGVILGGSMAIIMHRTDWILPVFSWMARDAPPWDLTPIARYDPSARLRGWAELGSAVGEILNQERRAGRDPFILTDDYQLASEIAFYCPGRPATYCAQAAFGGRRSQYDIWVNPIRERTKFIGRPCLYVGSLHPELTVGSGGTSVLARLRLARTVVHKVGGEPVRVWSIYLSPHFVGFDEPSRAPARY